MLGEAQIATHVAAKIEEKRGLRFAQFLKARLERRALFMLPLD